MGPRAIALSLVLCVASTPALLGQTKTDTPKTPSKTTAKAKTPEELNIQAYITLLRQDVSANKAKILGSMMQLDAEDAAKFWPIYRDYDAELSKVNDLRIANIMEYSHNYMQMTDEKADELVKNSISYQKQRGELLFKYYELMKQQLGAITAARFAQIETQLLMIIDLKVTSSLPVVGS